MQEMIVETHLNNSDDSGDDMQSPTAPPKCDSGEVTSKKDRGRCGTCSFFTKHTLRDIRRNKCHFCLAFSAVFIVVLSSLCVNSVIAQGPIVFLKLAEQQTGQIDALFGNPCYD